MTTAITTIKRGQPKGGINSLARRLSALLAALGDRITAWSAQHYETEKGIGEELEAIPPSQRLDAALRWHARYGRML